MFPKFLLGMQSNKSIRFGYKLSSEEFSAKELVRLARAAEERHFDFVLISDHFHPWSSRQGQSPFVWSVIGAISQVTSRLVVGTGVTCPSFRIHPAIVAQAAATIGTMMPGRFFLGVGTGENLNEHVVSQSWPEVEVRQEMLAEAIEVIRLLWQGGLQSHHGKHFTVENAQIFSLPEEPVPIMVAAAGKKSAEIAGRLGDGLIGTEPKGEMVEKFKADGQKGRPCYCEVQACFGPDEREAVELAREQWPIAGLPGPLLQELPLPSHFEKAGALVAPEKISETVACGPDPEKHARLVRKYLEAGYDHVCVHQIGPMQEEALDFYAGEVWPRVTGRRKAA